MGWWNQTGPKTKAQLASTSSVVDPTAASKLIGGDGNPVYVSDTYSPYYVKVDDYLIKVTTNKGPVRVVLPSLSSVGVNKEFIIKSDSTVSESKQVIIAGDGSDKIDGQRTFILDDAYSAVTIVSTNIGWEIF